MIKCMLIIVDGTDIYKFLFMLETMKYEWRGGGGGGREGGIFFMNY